MASSSEPGGGNVAPQLRVSAYTRSLDCVHCGLCLPVCPTYQVLGVEADSPRGRIYLMRALAEGRVSDPDAIRPFLDRCLDCRACETVCPSGVDYGRLVEAARAEISAATSAEKLTREVVLNRVFTSPQEPPTA